MNALIPTQSRLTMTSREIADLTGKQHSNVMRDIRNLLDTLSMDSSLNPCAKSITYDGKDGRAYAQYEVDKDTCLTLLLGYDPAARMKVVKRWQELEAQAQQPAIPQTLPDALRLAADLAEQKDQALAALALAAPKAQGFDRIANAEGLLSLRETATTLKIPEKQ
ncbi:Rha family transcriptional regulator, partial [Ventosimonas gracilis]|uniref:Rha family transcriptional regulator n=1 Tax=Ventosimonas gracilis TaxID=1680762 RepID=UPI00128F94BF